MKPFFMGVVGCIGLASAAGMAVQPPLANIGGLAGRVAIAAAFQPDQFYPTHPNVEVDLRPKFKPGQITRLRMVLDSVGDAALFPGLDGLDRLAPMDDPLDEPDTAKPAPGTTKPTKNTPTKPGTTPSKDPNEPAQQTTHQEIVLKLNVVQGASPERDAIVEMTYESLKIKMDGPAGPIEFDSTKPRKPNKPKSPSNPYDPLAPLDDLGDPLEAMLGNIVGSTLTITVDAKGNIKSVSGGQQLTGLGTMMGAGSGGELFKSIVTPVGSPGLVTVGQSWETRDTVKTGLIGEFQMTTKSKLKSASRGKAEVEFRGTIKPDSDGGPADPGSIQIKNSTYDGSYVWDTDRGMLKQMRSDQKVEIDLGQAAHGSNKGIKSRQTVKVDRID